ncbi:protein mono-ADP-ribosyltransferase PARP11 [Anabas testudineus]|uniref:Poly [ADP-ribose] polymerase n=1 Tax=Anabas testudineus TaxID=64144 RepID=A0A3Q1IUS9_ANATE|nr:protein mono-ADP-ribosyltransferase PARP11 [Anabas testudineus]
MTDDTDVELMDTSDVPWCWYYLADCGAWHRFEDDPDNSLKSGDIERHYLRDSKGVLKTYSSNCFSKIDFSAKLLTDLRTSRQRRIRRHYNLKKSCSCFNTAPVFWEKFDPTCPYQLIPLSELSPEYQTVAGYVKNDGLLDRRFISISRIQNLDLWEFYCRKKKQLMRIQGVSEIPERRLFHGTNVANVDTICKYNFDVRLAGRHGHIFGKGVYFARHATVADKYTMSSMTALPLYGGATSSADFGPTKVMFLARVIIGRPIVGESDFLKPDHESSENSHDSCVDDITHPNIFIIFDSNQIYPEYLIQYI